MKCRIQKPIDIPKPTEFLIDIVTGKRVIKPKETKELSLTFTDCLKLDPYFKNLSERELDKFLRDL